MAHAAECGLVWTRRWRGAVSGVVCQNRIAGSVQLPPVTRIKRCRDGISGGAWIGVDQALAWCGEWCGPPIPYRRQCAISACYAHQISANTKQRRSLA